VCINWNCWFNEVVCGSHQQSTDEIINEILIVGLGPAYQMTPYLFAMVDNDLVVYEGFHYHDNVHPGHLHLRFSKVSRGEREGERGWVD